MNGILRALGTLVLCIFAAAAKAAPLAWTVVDRPGYDNTMLWDINDQGIAVGSAGDGVVSRPFIWQQGQFFDLTPPDSAYGAEATGISNAGTIVGISYFADPSTSAQFAAGYVFEAGAYTPIGVPGAMNTYVRQMSPNGRYVGGYYDTDIGLTQGFVLDRRSGEFTFIGDGSTLVLVQGVNDHGQAVGSTFGPVRTSFVFDLASRTRADYTDINGLARPRFRDINNAGVVVGAVATSLAVGRPGEAFDLLDFGSSATGYGINSAGAVVGWYIDNDAGLAHGLLAMPVPEPATWLLWLLGAAALLAVRRGRERAPLSAA